MADSENTAVNDLIARAGGQTPGEPATDGAEHGAELGHEMGVETIPVGQMRAALGHEMGTETIPVGPRSRARGAIDPMHTTLPASMPVAAPFETRSAAMQSTYPAPRAEPDRPRKLFGGNGEHLVGTLQLSRRRPGSRDVVGKLLIPIALLVLAGVLIGAFIALRGPSPAPVARTASSSPAAAAVVAPVEPAATAPTPAPVAAAAPTVGAVGAPVAPAPVVTPVPAPAAFVDVRIDSTPWGATVTLVDRGKPQIVGETPISAAIDPSRDYDLVLTYAGKPTKTLHLDPRTTRRISFAFDAPVVEPARREPVRRAEPAKREAAPVKPAGEGTLMISSKPPCEIVIDGKATGLTTPQRAIPLAAGRHKVTLVNSEKDIRKTLSVDITADATAKVIEDLMN